LKEKSLIIGGLITIILGAFVFFNRSPLKIELPKGRESVLVCFGDSLTAGIGAPRGKSYPDYLKNYLDVKIVNKGVPGETASQGRERFEKDVLSLDPDIVIIEFGSNDYFRKTPSQNTRSHMEFMVDRLLDRGTVVFIAKFFPEKSIVSFIKSKDKKEYDKMYKELSSKDNVFLIEDIWGEAWGRPKYMNDTVHPNEYGYKIMADKYFEAVKDLFEYNNLLK
jgi:lysophospholipase L1-like esterase